MDFLPKDYTAPSSTGNYMKFKDGENTFRILSSAITGFEYWTLDNKPVRLTEKPDKTPSDIKLDKDGKPTKIRHFWAFVVYNENEKAIQILEVTQSSIQEGIKALVDNKKWGNPTKYDITVSRSGEGLETEYQVIPNPHSDVDKEVTDEFKVKNVRLEALFDGADPFAQADF